MSEVKMEVTEALRPAFKLRLTYREGKAAITSPEGRLGEYLRSGDGSLYGDTFSGTVHWDLYEVVGETRCQTNFAGQIETEDGAKIQFDARGLGIVPDRAVPHRWRIANTVRFDTADTRYAWLNDALGLWDGTFDMRTYQHYYKVYLPGS